MPSFRKQVASKDMEMEYTRPNVPRQIETGCLFAHCLLSLKPTHKHIHTLMIWKMKNPTNAKEETQHLLKVLKSLKQASQELQTNSNSSSAIKALLDLKNESDSLLSNDPHLSNLCQHLSNLETLKESQHDQHSLKSFLIGRVKSYEISRLARSIEAEIQAWFDRQTLTNLIRELQKLRASGPLIVSAIDDEDSLFTKLETFISCLTHGFNINLQDLLLKSNIFSELEWLLGNENMFKPAREKVAYALKYLVLFNKDVFVGQVLMGQTIRVLIKMGTLCSLEVLCAFIKAIKSPLVDEVESFGGITKLVDHLGASMDLSVKIVAMECVQEIGFYGRKEAIEALLTAGLTKRLMELQRSGQPFSSCVTRFAVQIEVGEGLRPREKRAFKQEIVKRVREASLSDAEAATVIAEVLWGSSP